MEKNFESMKFMINKVKPQLEIQDENMSLENGILDSLDIITLIDLLEETFSIKIPGRCLKQENFCSPKMVLKMLKRIEEE